jgi:hypothetical protein
MKIEIGAKGWFTPAGGDTLKRQRAEVVRVWSDTCVNLRCADGTVVTSVHIKQAGWVGYSFEPDQVDATEQLILDKGATVAPRVTKDDLLREIVGETYTVLPSGRVTVCELTMRNGFTVRGESAVVFIENFDAEIGRKVARQNAESQAWQLLGYALKSQAACPTDEMLHRFLAWPVPASVYPDGTPGQPGRTGTNLLSAQEARQMLEHVLGQG